MKHLITEGELTIKGKNAEGQELEVTADISRLDIEVEDNSVTFNSIHDFNPYSVGYTTTTLKAKVSGNGSYKVKILSPSTGVERTARVLARVTPENVEVTELTLKDIRIAAEVAGVDENAEFYTVTDKDIRSFTVRQYVAFRWTE